MDSGYLIEILLTARDEASSKIAGLQRQVEELKAKSAAGDATKDLRQGLDDTADSADRAAESHKELNKQQDESRRAAPQSASDIKRVAQYQEEAAESTAGHAESTEELRRQQQLLPADVAKSEAAVKRVTDQHDQATESVATHAAAHDVLGDSVSASTDELEKERDAAQDVSNALKETKGSTDDVSDAQAKLAARVDETYTNFEGLKQSFASGSGDLKELRQTLQATGTELQSLSRRFKTASGDAIELRDAAEEAGSMAKYLQTLESSSRQPLVNATGLDKAKQDLANLTQQYKQFDQTVRASQSQDVGRAIDSFFASRFRSVAGRLPTGTSDFSSAMEQSVAARALSRPVTEAATAPGESVSIAPLLRLKQLNQAAQDGTATNSELRAGYTQLTSSLRSLGREFDVGSSEARKFGSAMDEAGQKAKNIDLARSSTSFTQFAQKFAQATDGIGVKVISLSAALRGFRLVGIVGLLQPLDTGLLSLAGSFASVASGAAQAAAAIGGVFLSGLGQLIPMVSIGVAALIRLRDVFQAVSASQSAKQQSFFEPNQGLITQLQNTSELIQSEQSLANAYYTLNDAQVQVRESQMALTQARIDAIRNITDLTLAEKNAQLELKGANLSLVQAQEQERMAQTSGDQQQIAQAQLGVQQAQLSQRQAQIGVPRSKQDLSIALGYGIAGSPTVLSASEAARQAQLGVVQAQQQIAAAQRQEQITKLTLAQPASSESQQQATLQYLESQMSAPELALFHSLDKIETMLRSPNGPLKKITDSIIQPFMAMSTRLQQLLGDPSFLAPITKLAQAMGGEFGSIEKVMFGQRGTSFFETMAKDATSSIPVITKSITGLMHVFEDIATAAAPAFKKLSEDWARFWDAMDARDRSPQGQQRLTDFFNKAAGWAVEFAHLAAAVFDLFKALGSDAAPQGMKIVTSFTEAIHDATSWVQTHGPEVTKFFSDARQGLSAIASVLLNIGRSMIAVFSLSSLQALATLINAIVFPAIRNVTNVIGFLVKGLMDLINFGFKPLGIEIRPIADLLEGIATAFVGLLVVNRVIEGVTKLGTAFSILKGAVAGFRAAEGGIISKLGGAWSGGSAASKGLNADATSAATGMNTAGDKMVTAADTFAGAADKMTAAASEEVTAGTSQQAAGTEEITAGTEQQAAGAEEMGGGGGLLAGGGGLLAGAGLTAILADVATKLFNRPVNANEQQYLSSGGQVPGAYSMAGATGLFQSKVDPKLANQLLSETNGLNVATQSTTALDQLKQKAEEILRLPDITTTQRQGLQKLIAQLNPANVAMQRAEQQWATTFSGISSTTGNVMQQVQQTLNQNIQTISTNLGTGTKQGAQALVGTIYDAWESVLNNTSAAVRGTEQGVKEIAGMLNRALKAMGQAPLSSKQVASLQPTVVTGLLSGLLTSGGVASPHAAGGWHDATGSGRIVQVAEGGHDEVTLTTDPKYAPRQRALLGRYLQHAPHLAQGGFVADPGTNFTVNQEPRIVAALGKLANYIHQTIYGISGYRSPSHSVAVGGFSDDPHTKGEAADIGVGSSLRASAGALSNALLAKFGLWRPFDMQGQDPNEINHVQLLPSLGGPQEGITAPRSGLKSIGAVVAGAAASTSRAIAQALKAPHVAAAGALGAIAQGAVNRVTAAANQLLGPQGGTSGGGASRVAMPSVALSGPIMKQVYEFMSAAGFNKTAIAGMLGNALQESSLDPNDAGGGFWQQVSNFGSGSGGSLLHQMQTMLPQIESLKAAMNAARSPGDAAVIFQNSFERPAVATENEPRRIAGAESAYAQGYAGGGLLTRHLRRLGLRKLRKSVLRFAEGGRAPWGGAPVEITAHEGERVVNPPQWEELGRVTGMGSSGLDSHLGYDTASPRQSFDAGGPVPISSRSQQRSSTSAASTSLSALNSFLTSIAGNLFTMDPGSLADALKTIGQVFTKVNQGFMTIGKLGGKDTSSQLSQLNNLINALDNQTDGLLLQLSNAFQRFQNNLSNWVTRVGYGLQNVTGASAGRRTKSGYAGTGYGGVRYAGPQLSTSTIGQSGQAGVDELTLNTMVQQGTYLADEEKTVQAAISRVKQNIGRVQSAHGLSKATRDKAIKDLETNYTGLIQQLENLQNSMNENVTSRLQQEQTVIQDRIDQVNDIFETQQAVIQGQQTVAQTQGNYGQLAGFDKAMATSASAQLQALQPVLKDAERIKDPDLVAQIKQQMAQLQATVAQSAAQAIQDQISAIQQVAQTQQAQVSEYQTIAQTMQGAASTPGQFAAAGALNASALNINQSSLQGQLSQYNTLLGQASAQGNTGAVATITQTIDELTAQLAQNYQAIQDNTAQVVQQTSQYIQARGQFTSGVYGGLGQIIQTIGQTTGYTNVGALQAVTGQSNQALQGTNAGLVGQLGALGGGASGIASMLQGVTNPQQFVQMLSSANLTGAEAGQSATWISTFESIVSSLETNTEAIAQNNQQLATLNGQLLQPQSWSSTSWSAFRNAIFSGMGNLLPQYQSTLTGSAVPTIAPVFNPVTGTTTTPTIGTMNINHVPAAAVDPQILGQQMAFESSTAIG